VRTVIAIIAALLIAVQVVRNAAVLALAGTRPAEAARVWNGHPASELGLALTQIAEASRGRHAVPASAFALGADAAQKDPLAPEPFLVRGVQAQVAGDGTVAQRAFEAAQWRDPRSLPAAYFLADRYLRSGQAASGLREVAALARLSPDGGTAASPYLAQYASNPANWPALRALFQANPQLSHPVLVALAGNISTVPAVLALAQPGDKAGAAQWLPPLLDTVTTAGAYAKARAIWAQATGARIQPGQLLYDSSFSDRSAPPPFNWRLTTSSVGLAERQPGGRLHVLFYGQEDGTLANQLLVLQPGVYRLSIKLMGDPARAHVLTWSLWCDKSAEPAASVTLDVAAARGWQFQVPNGCGAQWLKLSGSSSDMPQQTDVTIAALRLEKVATGA
jgi:hypothetical protein